MQNSLSKLKLIDYLTTYSSSENRETLEDSSPLELISLSLDMSIGHVSEQTVKHIAFVVLASFNLAKAGELIDDLYI